MAIQQLLRLGERCAGPAVLAVDFDNNRRAMSLTFCDVRFRFLNVSDTLDLLILDTGTPSKAVAYGRYGSDTAITFLPSELLGQLADFREQLAKAAAGSGPRPTPEQLSVFGQRLFELLVRDGVAELYHRLPPSHIRMQVLSNQPAFQSLPWEYIKEPLAPAGPNSLRSVVRIVPTLGMPEPQLRPRKKIRVLFAYADPIDQPGVGWEDIHATITSEFRTVLSGNEFQIDVIEGASSKSLSQALLQGSYDILHFNGHGEIVGGVGNLVLVNSRTGRTELMQAGKLAGLLKGRELQLVVLSTCNGAAGDFAEAYAVIAHGLVLQGIPAVVANQFAITTSVAATFVCAFYRTLLRTGDVDQAVADGRTMLYAQPCVPRDASLEWGIPTLYRHISASRLFTNA